MGHVMRAWRPLTAERIATRPVPGSLRAEYRRLGYVTDQTVGALPRRAARHWPGRTALVEEDRELTYAELLGLVDRAAGWLAGAGVGPGDVVCWQTPNWWEAHVLGLAIWHAGAVSCPVVPVYREHELRQIIGQVRPAVVIAAGEFRGFKHAGALDELLAETGLDGAARVILRGSRPRWTPFDEVVAASPLRPGAAVRANAVPASEPCLILLALHLQAVGLARQKTPVARHFADALPMTPAGKVKKFELVAHQEPLTVTGRNQ